MILTKKRSSFYLAVMCGLLSAFNGMQAHWAFDWFFYPIKEGARQAGQGFNEGMNSEQGSEKSFLSQLAKDLYRLMGEGQSLDLFVKQFWVSVKKHSGENGFDVDKITSDLRKSFSPEVKESSGVKGSPEGEGYKALVRANASFNDVLLKPTLYKLAGLTLFIVSVHYGSKIAWRYIEKQMNKPRVMSEYHHTGWLSKMMSLIKTPAPIVDISYPQETQDRLDQLVKELKLIIKKKNDGIKNVSYRKVVLTGVSSLHQLNFAKQCAQKSGIDFAIITGASLFQKGAGVAAIDELCALAQKSKTGLCLIVDRADPLLLDSVQLDPSSETYQIISHFHNCLRDNGDKLMLVATSNGKDLLQKAKLIEIDEVIEIAL